MAQITVSPDLLKLLADKLYRNDHAVILTRELFQNAVDACQDDNSVIKVSIEDMADCTKLTMDDNGIGMSKDTLENIFLVLGATGKVDGIGGFGIAKAAIFASESWEVHTRDNFISSSDMTTRKVKSRRGTRVTCTIPRYGSIDSMAQMITLSRIPEHIRVKLNRKTVKPYVGRVIKHVCDDFIIHTVPTRGLTRMIFRIRGLVQYTECNYQTRLYDLIIDFDRIGFRPRDDNYPFTMSREGIRGKYFNRVYELTQKINMDSITNMEESKVKVKQYTRAGIVYEHLHKGSKFNLHDKRLLKAFTRILEVIEDDKIIPGLTDDRDCIAKRTGMGIYYLNPDSLHDECTSTYTTIAVLWHLACHESAHRYESSHTERFTVYESQISRESADKVFKDDRLKEYTRYYLENKQTDEELKEILFG